ncbi:MAG TPA: hypothetical protein VJ808_11445 [Gemmatimonadales bacterium]|nr:hypothetical protein [Gemmatimonadales bacterium]
MTFAPEHDHIAPMEEVAGLTVVSGFLTPRAAEAAVRDLRQAGFSREQIGIVMQDRGKPSLGSEAVAASTRPPNIDGGLTGGLVGLFGSLLIPGLGPLLLGGVLASALTGMSADWGKDGLTDILAALGVPRPNAEHFEQSLRSGGILLTVNGAARTGEALAVIVGHGADLAIDRSVFATSHTAPDSNAS